MNIGINIDGVLTNLVEYIIINGQDYFKEPTYINNSAYSFRQIFSCSKNDENNFWRKNILKYYLRCKCEKDSQEVIRKLRENGHKVYIIANRKNLQNQNITGEIYRTILKYWLKKNQVECDGIIYCDPDKSKEEKIEICKQFNIDIIIEDQIRDAIILSKITDVIVMDRPYNMGMNQFTRAKNFKDIYEIINNRSKGVQNEIKLFI